MPAVSVHVFGAFLATKEKAKATFDEWNRCSRHHTVRAAVADEIGVVTLDNHVDELGEEYALP